MELFLTRLFPVFLTLATTVSDANQLAADLVVYLTQKSLANCNAVALQTNHYEDFTLQKILASPHSPPWMTYTTVGVNPLSPPPPTTLRGPQSEDTSGGELCITYLLLMDLEDAGNIYQLISRSDWYPGAARYFVWFGGYSVTPEQIGASKGLFEAYNTLYISVKGDGFNLFSNCPFCDSGEPEIVLRNTWLPDSGLQRDGELFPDLFTDCNGHVFRAVSLQYPPFLVYSKPSEDYQGPVTIKDSIDVRIMNSIADTYNFTFEVYEPTDGKWGFQLPNGSWTGVIGTVERYEADMSMNVLITADRDESVDFTIGYHSEPLTFVTTKPRPLPQWLSLVRPYSADVWVSLLVVLSFSGLFYFGINKLSSSPGKKVQGRNSTGLTSSYFVMMGSFLTQSQKWRRHPASLLFSSMWILFSLVTTIYYISTLTAFLTVPSLSPTLETLDQLVKSDFTWGIADYGAADYQLFKTSKVPLYQEIYRGLQFCPSLIECIKQTQKEQFAYISWRTYMRDAIALELTDVNGDTNIHMARQDFFPGDLGFAIQKGSPLKRPFDEVIRRLVEVGFVPKWVTEFIEQHKVEGRQKAISKARERGDFPAEVSDETSKSLSMHHLQGIFYVFALCLLGATAVFFAELAISKLKGNSKERLTTQ